jgi:uncharacterized protein (TIGR02598 family)
MKRVAGFSLVEVVVTIGVIAFSLVAIIGLLPIGLKSGRASIQETRANQIAQQIFNTIRSQPFNAVNFGGLGNASANVDLSSTTTTSTTRLYATYDGNFVAAADYFTIDIQYSNTPTGLNAGTANEVHVKITPRESGTQALYYATIIAAQ